MDSRLLFVRFEDAEDSGSGWGISSTAKNDMLRSVRITSFSVKNFLLKLYRKKRKVVYIYICTNLF